MGDAGDDGLLAVWTHSLHRGRLEHLPLQDGDGRGRTRGRQNGGRVTGHVTWTRAKLAWHGLRKVTGWVEDSCVGRTKTAYLSYAHALHDQTSLEMQTHF